jgi:hypothetical protein
MNEQEAIKKLFKASEQDKSVFDLQIRMVYTNTLPRCQDA